MLEKSNEPNEPKLFELMFELLFVLKLLLEPKLEAPLSPKKLAILQPHSWQNFWLISFVPHSGQNFINFIPFSHKIVVRDQGIGVRFAHRES